jgi:hypothetical protein
MATMTISDLRPAGHALLSDSEGFISDLSDEELGLRGAFSNVSQPASLSNSAPASASHSASNSASNSGYSASASHSASNSGYSASASHSASDSGYSASASHGSHYSMPQSNNSSFV